MVTKKYLKLILWLLMIHWQFIVVLSLLEDISKGVGLVSVDLNSLILLDIDNISSKIVRYLLTLSDIV